MKTITLLGNIFSYYSNIRGFIWCISIPNNIKINIQNAKQYRRISNFDQNNFLNIFKSQISKCFSIFNIDGNLDFGDFINFIYNVSYQFDYLGIRNQYNYYQYDCFKVIFKKNNIFFRLKKLINNQNLLLFLENNIIFYLLSIQSIRNLVNHGSFILNHEEKIDQVGYYYVFYHPFVNYQSIGPSTNWFGQKYNNICELEKVNN